MKLKISKSQWEKMGKTAGWLDDKINNPTMMPGQTPYTKEETKQLHNMVGDAAKGDMGEKNEPKERETHFVIVTFDDGDIVRTTINGTKEEIVKYYTKQNFTKQDESGTHKGVNVEFVN